MIMLDELRHNGISVTVSLDDLEMFAEYLIKRTYDDYNDMTREIQELRLKCEKPYMFSRAEVAKKFAVSTSTIKRWVQLGLLKEQKIGRAARYDVRDVETFVKKTESNKKRK